MVRKKRRRNSNSAGRLAADAALLRRRRLTEMRLMGWSVPEMAKDLDCCTRTILRDLELLREDWKRELKLNRDEMMADQVQHLYFIRNRAIESFLKSLEPAHKRVVKESYEGVETSNTTEEQCGDPRFLEVIRKATADLRDLHGLIDPELANARITADATVTDVIEVVIEDRAQLEHFKDEQGAISIDAFRRRLISMGVQHTGFGGNGDGH
jgi:hypothetical protein